MSYNYTDRRSVAVLAAHLDMAVALNVLAHLAISIGAHADAAMLGRPRLRDGSGISHLGISKYAVIIKRATVAEIRDVVVAARSAADILLADYPRQMLTTAHDDELASALESAPEDAIEYLGVLMYGPRPQVDTICRKLPLWR